jgi:hypothetical protein
LQTEKKAGGALVSPAACVGEAVYEAAITLATATATKKKRSATQSNKLGVEETTAKTKATEESKETCVKRLPKGFATARAHTYTKKSNNNNKQLNRRGERKQKRHRSHARHETNIQPPSHKQDEEKQKEKRGAENDGRQQSQYGRLHNEEEGRKGRGREEVTARWSKCQGNLFTASSCS